MNRTMLALGAALLLATAPTQGREEDIALGAANAYPPAWVIGVAWWQQNVTMLDWQIMFDKRFMAFLGPEKVPQISPGESIRRAPNKVTATYLRLVCTNEWHDRGTCPVFSAFQHLPRSNVVFEESTARQ